MRIAFFFYLQNNQIDLYYDDFFQYNNLIKIQNYKPFTSTLIYVYLEPRLQIKNQKDHPAQKP